MTGFFRRGSRLERELRAARPRAADELVSRIEARVRSEQPKRVRRGAFRIAVPVVVTATMVGALAAVGGVSYAASSVESAAKAASHVLVPTKVQQAGAVRKLTSGGDQYVPGYSWDDPSLAYVGPPAIAASGSGGAFAPPLVPKPAGLASVVSTSFTLGGQAHLFVSVIDKKTGQELLITQTKSQIGGALSGVQAKNLNYLVLVPRTIPIKLAVPSNLLKAGGSYSIRIIARAPDGDQKTILIPFSA